MSLLFRGINFLCHGYRVRACRERLISLQIILQICNLFNIHINDRSNNWWSNYKREIRILMLWLGREPIRDSYFDISSEYFPESFSAQSSITQRPRILLIADSRLPRAGAPPLDLAREPFFKGSRNLYRRLVIYPRSYPHGDRATLVYATF